MNKYGRGSAGRRDLLSRGLFYAVATAASVTLAYVFIHYFVEPRDLAHRLLSRDGKTAGGFAGAGFLNPLFAAAMLLSSLAVVGDSLRLTRASARG